MFGISPIIWETIVTGGLLLLTLLLAFIVRLIWRRVLLRIARRTPTGLDNRVVLATAAPASSLVVVAGFRLALKRLAAYPAIAENVVYRLADGVLYVLIVLIFVLAALKVVRAFTTWYKGSVAVRTKTRIDDEFVPFIELVAKIVFIFIGSMIVLDHFEVNISGFLATAGIASLAVALAAQETIANLISGFAIMMDRPFRVNDRIELTDGTIGDVREIGMRTTRILTFDNTIVVYPNSEMAKAKIVNYGYPDPQVKIRQNIGVAYGSDIAKVKEIMVHVCRDHPKVLDDPEPAAFFVNFADSALEIRLIAWVPDYRDKFAVTDEILCEIDRRFRETDVEIPFPQRDIHIRSGRLAPDSQ